MNRLINTLLFLLPFLCVEAVLRFMPVADMPFILPVTAHDPIAHFQPSTHYVYSRDWNFSVHQRKRTNNFGYVNRIDYEAKAQTPLFTVIGDSYVEAHGIEEGKSVGELLHRRVAPGGRVYSIGLSGAALPTYMTFAQFARDTFHPQAMAIVIISNDFDESLLKYKSEPRFHYFTDNGELRLVDYELAGWKKILRHSALVRYVVLNLEPARTFELVRRRVRPVDADEQKALERVADSERAIVYFLDQLPARSGLDPSSIVLVQDAVRPALYSPEALRQADDSYFAQMRRYFAEQARARGYNVVDMQPTFIARHQADGSHFELAPTDGHWNALGHRLAAAEIEKSAPFVRLFGQHGAQASN